MKSHTLSNVGTTADSDSGSDIDLIEKLKSAPFYQTYQNAFRTATGLPLVIVAVDGRAFNPCYASPNQNPFCRALNSGGSPCSGCVTAQRCSMNGAHDRACTVDCFAGLKETVVPLRLGNRTIGYLKTGQVLTSKPSATAIAAVRTALEAAGRPVEEVDELVQLYRQTPVFKKERYASTVTLLSAFALQLAALANRVLLEGRRVEPEPVRLAKQFITEHIDERISLESVANAVNVSTYYFCKIFKQATGMTFTEYVNRQRIELAKRELLKPGRRVTEIAYDVGYQSLSQFNRSFLRIVGESPSMFRTHMTSAKGSHLVA